MCLHKFTIYVCVIYVICVYIYIWVPVTNLYIWVVAIVMVTTFGGPYRFPGFCGNQHVRDPFMHASSFMCIHVLSFSFMFLSLVFNSIHFPFIFLSFSFQCAFMSPHLPFICTHFPFILYSCPFISFLKLWKWLYGLAREPSATNGYR